jgi:hypothetical protein
MAIYATYLLHICTLLQGLRDSVYYLCTYMWMLGMFCVFMAIFACFGALIGLKIFTLTDWSLQLVFYFIWGNVLTANSFYMAVWMNSTRPAGEMRLPLSGTLTRGYLLQI